MPGAVWQQRCTPTKLGRARQTRYSARRCGRQFVPRERASQPQRSSTSTRWIERWPSSLRLPLMGRLLLGRRGRARTLYSRASLEFGTRRRGLRGGDPRRPGRTDRHDGAPAVARRQPGRAAAARRGSRVDQHDGRARAAATASRTRSAARVRRHHRRRRHRVAGGLRRGAGGPAVAAARPVAGLRRIHQATGVLRRRRRGLPPRRARAAHAAPVAGPARGLRRRLRRGRGDR